MDWGEFKSTYEPLEACKILMKEYIKFGSYQELHEKYGATIVTIRNFLDRNYRSFDREAKSLEKRVRAIAHKNRSNNLKKVKDKVDRLEKPREKSTKDLTRIKIRNLNVLDTLPQVIKYREFLNIISKQDIHTLTTNDWIRAAESKGIKIIGVETPKWLK